MTQERDHGRRGTLRWRLATLPRRLQGRVPGASKAEALEDLVLLSTLLIAALLFCLFLVSSVGGATHDRSEAAWAVPSSSGRASHHDSPKHLKPVRGVRGIDDPTAATSAGGGGDVRGGSGDGGGGGGRGAGSGRPTSCDAELGEAVRTSIVQMFSFWQHRDPAERCPAPGAGQAQRRR